MNKLSVFHLPGAWGLPTVSPFCLRLETFLRLTGIEHEVKTAATPFPGPKKKAPWIEYQGRKIGDSSLIIAFLKNEFGVDPDAHLNQQQRGVAVAVQRLIEENLYWALVYDRWCRSENWAVLKNTVLGDIPAPVRMVVAPIARRSVKKQLLGHGMGLHSEAEIAGIANRDIDALAAILADQNYIFGDRPCMADAAIYSLLANIYFVEFASPMKAMITAHPNLVSMLERFKADIFPESSAGPIITAAA
ncbi:MAG: glutathione S-transferase family protein [Erythrobacter sp.]